MVLEEDIEIRDRITTEVLEIEDMDIPPSITNQKICKKYLTHIQNSVFEGELSKG